MTNAFTSSGLFGDLFRDTAIAEQFGSAAFTARMLEFQIAWTGALAQTGVVSQAEAEAARAVLEGFDGADLGAGSDRDGLPVPSLVAALKAGQPEGTARAIHVGATSQDVIDTAMVLTCRAVLAEFEARLSRVVQALDELIARFGETPMMARTRMQAALPATAALRLDGWRRALLGHQARIAALREELSEVQIGGAIGSRQSPKPHVEACAPLVAQALGLTLGPVWHADRSRMVSFGHWMTLLTGSLGKIGQDVALMAQQGLDEIALSGGGGSSAMAHKQNPVAAEALVALSRYVAGQQAVLAQAMVHEQERSGAAWALEWLTLPAMAEATGAALTHAERLLGAVERIGTPD